MGGGSRRRWMAGEVRTRPSNQSGDDGSKPELRTIQRFATVDGGGSRRRFRSEPEFRTIQRFATVDGGGSRR
ncbi:hypothetical protein U1Q18_002365, partial [Sarracenia purpurea var. burkii]